MKYKKFKKLMKRWNQSKSQNTELIPEYHYLESSFTNIDPNAHLSNVHVDYDPNSTTATTGMDSFSTNVEQGDKYYQSEYYQRGIITPVKPDATPFDWMYNNYPITIDSFTDFQTDCVELFIKKHKNYGPHNLIRETTELTVEGIMLRIKDKLNRINNLIHNGADGGDESVQDSLMDICNYTTIIHLILQDKWGK
jgi:hypothetical protein